MKLTKILVLWLTLSSVAALGSIAHAEVVNNNDGTQTINNSTDPIVTDAEVEVSGLLGFDNTNPITPEPGDPDKWINVTLPSAVLFQTDESTNHKDIISPDYGIENHSGRPVRVNVSNYALSSNNQGNLANIDYLSLSSIGMGTPISLVSSGVLESTHGQELMTLGSPKADIANGDLDRPSNRNFSFIGETATSWETSQTPEQIDTTLTLSMTPLQSDGLDYPVNP